PLRIKLFILVALCVTEAFPPRQTIRAANTALLPEPLWPTMKLIAGPRVTSRCLWHMKFSRTSLLIIPGVSSF
ncbi:hypothetical protein CANCADRAFT_27020, partial [Tortispora caseinolytica NRRL Y-17796]